MGKAEGAHEPVVHMLRPLGHTCALSRSQVRAALHTRPAQLAQRARLHVEAALREPGHALGQRQVAEGRED
eukprot:4415509-Pyramimonas_sp.AAC.1